METNVTDQAGTLQMIPISQVRPSELNPRKQFDQAKLEELSASLKEQGLIEPLVVRRTLIYDVDDDHNEVTIEGGYEIVAGERRYRAAKLAGLTELPCIVRQMDDRTTAEAMVVENMQRDDLTPMEEARAFKAYLDADAEATVKSLAQRIGKSDDFVRERMRLLELPEAMQGAVEDGKLPLKAALVLTRISDAEVRRELYDSAVHGELTPSELRNALMGTFIDLHNASFPLAAGPSCDGCQFRVFRGGAMMLPGLDGKKKDIGMCTNPECFRDKTVSYLETKVGAKVMERDAMLKEYKRPHRLWEEKWKPSCAGCQLKLVVLTPSVENGFQRWCGDSDAHFGRTNAVTSDEEYKRNAAKEREKQRQRQEQHRLALELLLDWLEEKIVTRDGARFVAQTLCNALGYDNIRGAAQLLGIETKECDPNHLQKCITKQIDEEPSSAGVMRICSILAVVRRFGARPSPYSSELPIVDFLKQIGIKPPKVEAKPKKAAKEKAAKAASA